MARSYYLTKQGRQSREYRSTAANAWRLFDRIRNENAAATRESIQQKYNKAVNARGAWSSYGQVQRRDWLAIADSVGRSAMRRKTLGGNGG